MSGGIVGQNVRDALAGSVPTSTTSSQASAGARSRRRSLRQLVADVLEERLEPARLHFLDLNADLVERELARTSAERRSGPHAENILRDLGVVAAGSH